MSPPFHLVTSNRLSLPSVECLWATPVYFFLLAVVTTDRHSEPAALLKYTRDAWSTGVHFSRGFSFHHILQKVRTPQVWALNRWWEDASSCSLYRAGPSLYGVEMSTLTSAPVGGGAHMFLCALAQGTPSSGKFRSALT